MAKGKTTINLRNFTPNGGLGQLFARAKFYNKVNKQLVKLLPKHLQELELCLIENDIATLITKNQAIAYRGQKQQKVLLDILHKIENLEHIQQITIKVDM